MQVTKNPPISNRDIQYSNTAEKKKDSSTVVHTTHTQAEPEHHREEEGFQYSSTHTQTEPEQSREEEGFQYSSTHTQAEPEHRREEEGFQYSSKHNQAEPEHRREESLQQLLMFMIFAKQFTTTVVPTNSYMSLYDCIKC